MHVSFLRVLYRVRQKFELWIAYALQNYGEAYVDTYEIEALVCQRVK